MKVTGIKKAVGDYNNHVGHAKIMLDMEKCEVWCDIFASGGEWKAYHNVNITSVAHKGYFHMNTNWDKVSMKEVESAVELQYELRKDNYEIL